MLEQDLIDISSADEATRLAAMQRLAESDQPQAVSVLIALLENTEESYQVFAAAARYLGTIGDARAVDPLIQAANQTKYEDIAAIAATALGRLGDPRAVECLAALLNRWHHSEEVMTATACALAALGAVEVLTTAVNEGDEETSWAAAEALASSSHNQALVTAISDDEDVYAVEWRAAVRVMVNRRDSDALNSLLDSLKSPYYDVRIRAANALARLADPRSADALRGALGDSESSVRVAAISGLHRIGSPPSEEEMAAGAMKAYAALGLKVQSLVALDIKCLHCSKVQAAPIWPVRGDRIPFYSQADPAEFSIKMTCRKCGGVWFTVWDSDPGRIYPLQT